MKAVDQQCHPNTRMGMLTQHLPIRENGHQHGQQQRPTQTNLITNCKGHQMLHCACMFFL